jgi:hypothetical protein
MIWNPVSEVKCEARRGTAPETRKARPKDGQGVKCACKNKTPRPKSGALFYINNHTKPVILLSSPKCIKMNKK